mgnify:CR=1 FL=1
MAKINPEEADLCCDSCEVHENLVKIVNETMPDEEELYDLADLFKVFCRLYSYPYSICLV